VRWRTPDQVYQHACITDNKTSAGVEHPSAGRSDISMSDYAAMPCLAVRVVVEVSRR
jgi:hypothetical protein